MSPRKSSATRGRRRGALARAVRHSAGSGTFPADPEDEERRKDADQEDSPRREPRQHVDGQAGEEDADVHPACSTAAIHGRQRERPRFGEGEEPTAHSPPTPRGGQKAEGQRCHHVWATKDRPVKAA